MDLRLPDEIDDLARSARQALVDPGLSRAGRAMAGQGPASAETAAALDALGLGGIDPRRPNELLAGAHLALEVGRVGNIVPVAGRLAAAAVGRSGLLQSIPASGDVVLVNHAAGSDSLAGVTLDGDLLDLSLDRRTVTPPPLAPFAITARRGEVIATGQIWAWALYEVIEAFASLGAAQAACDLSRDHLRTREQFGKPLGAQQSLQHRYADMILATAGLWELAHYTAWRLSDSPDQAVLDALALRVQHLEAVRTVFRNAHQIHAAVGFCDEHPLSVLSRAVRFPQYVPLSYDDTLDALIGHLSLGFEALFPIAPPR
jgi:hypothetical protein